jgi:uncharacterized protein (TIGR00251 family)
MIAVQQQGDSVTFSVKVHPRARLERIAGVLGNALKLEITAPPVDGKANEACIRFFADLLKVPRSSVTIAAGNSSRNKVIRVVGISAARGDETLTAALNG